MRHHRSEKFVTDYRTATLTIRRRIVRAVGALAIVLLAASATLSARQLDCYHEWLSEVQSAQRELDQCLASDTAAAWWGSASIAMCSYTFDARAAGAMYWLIACYGMGGILR